MNDYMRKRLELINAGRPSPPKKKYVIPKKSAKRIEKEKTEREERGDNDSDLQKFFRSKMKLMRGKCMETGAATNTKIYSEAIKSICHILPKSKFKSVATHPVNWMEYSWDFHHKFDNMLSWGDKLELKSWPIIEERIMMMSPNIAKEELRYLPDFLRDKIETQLF